MQRVHELQARQGWTDETLGKIGLDFIKDYGQVEDITEYGYGMTSPDWEKTLLDYFVEHLEEVAKEENGE